MLNAAGAIPQGNREKWVSSIALGAIHNHRRRVRDQNGLVQTAIKLFFILSLYGKAGNEWNWVTLSLLFAAVFTTQACAEYEFSLTDFFHACYFAVVI